MIETPTKEDAMVTVIRAGIERGYSGYDHMITGTECHDIIGHRFRDIAGARRAAEKAARKTAPLEVRIAPVWIEVRFDGSHETQLFGG